VTKRREGPKVDHGPQEECPFRPGQPGGSQKGVKIPDNIDEPRKSFYINRFKDYTRTDRGRFTHIIEGMRQKYAKNSRSLGERRRQFAVRRAIIRDGSPSSKSGDPVQRIV